MARGGNKSANNSTNNSSSNNEDLNYSFTAWSPLQTVKDISDELGLTNISNDVLKTLAMDVEYRILEVIENANKLKKFSKRSKLTHDDIQKSMELLNLEPLFGYGHYNNKSSQAVGSEILSKFKKMDTSSDNKNSNISEEYNNRFYIDEEEVDFDKLINEPLPEAPRITTFTSHWLAVEGVQPNIAQNPNIHEDIRLKYSPLVRGSIVTSINENTLVLSNENDQKDDDANNENNDNDLEKENNADSSQDAKATNQNKSINSNVKIDGKDVEIKLRVKHVISKELQIYFEKITKSLLEPSEEYNDLQKESIKQAALQSLSSDKGIHQLLPYFIAFINEQITYNLHDLEKLTTLLEMVFSILVNKDFSLEPYYNSLIPCILTLLLAKNIGKLEEKSTENGEDAAAQQDALLDKSLAIRNFSSQVLAHILSNKDLNKSNIIEKTIKPKIIRTILKTFLDKNRSMGTYYGCFKILIIMGTNNTEIIRWFLGNLFNWCEVVLPESDNKDAMDVEESGKPQRFTDKEKQILLDVILEFLEVLNKDLPNLIAENANKELTTEEKAKLMKVVGGSVFSKIESIEIERKRKIYESIFLGII
ncbi:hypothetical protein ACO0OL_003935 [Hanseniaspora opuntiae]